MNRFDQQVTVVTDLRFVETALAIRALLEAFRVPVAFVRLVQARHAREFFAKGGGDFTVLACHGFTDHDDIGLVFDVVDNDDPDPRATDGWFPSKFRLTPDNLVDVVTGLRGTVLSLACGGGRESLARAFLDAGMSDYIGATEPYLDNDAAILFTASLLYFLLAEDRDLDGRKYSLAEAIEHAQRFDDRWAHGTASFRLWSS